MRYVRQKHKNGCGVASFAMVAGIGYDKAMKIIDPKRVRGSVYDGTPLEWLLKACSKSSIRYRMIFKKINLKRLKNNAYISYSQPCGCRHAVVWYAKDQEILDPDPIDHNGKKYRRSNEYIQKHLNYIVEIIPS